METSANSVPDLVQAWETNARVNEYLLEAIPDEHLQTLISKTRRVDAQFAHIHNVRLMWLKASDPEKLEGLSKLEKEGLTREVLGAALTASAKAISNLIEESIASGKRIKNFKPNTTAFVAYFVAHEANHRAQIELGLRQADFPLSDKVSYGLWEWGSR